MKSPLIPDSENPKWIIAKFILEAIGSGRAKKTTSRLKIPDVERFIDIMKIIMIADLFERVYSDFISELKDNEKLKTFMGVRKIPDLEYLYKLVMSPRSPNAGITSILKGSILINSFNF